MMNVLIGSMGPRKKDEIDLVIGEVKDFSFVSYDDVTNLSLYVETEGSAALKSSLYDSEWNLIRENTTDIDSKEQGFVQLFKDLEIQGGRSVFLLRLEKISGDGNVRVISRNGGTSIYAYGGFPFAAFLYGATSLLLFLVGAGVFICLYKRLSYEKVFLAIAIPMVILFSVLLYPGTACDENDHYVEAYKLSNKILSVDTNLIREEDLSIVSNRWAVPTIEGAYLAINQIGHRTENTTLVLNEHSGHAGNAIVYLLPAVGITVSRILNLNAFTTYYAARGLNILFYLASGYLSLSICSYGQGILLGFLLLPLTINQCISVNQDNFCFCISFLAIAFWTHLKKKELEDEKVTVLEAVCLLLISLMLLASKAYAIILGMYIVLVIPKVKALRDRRKDIFLIMSILVCAVCVALLLGKSGYTHYLFTALFGEANGGRYSLKFYLDDPLTGWQIFVATIKQQWFQWFWDAFGSKLSWQTYFTPIYAVCFAVILVLLARSESGEIVGSSSLERIAIIVIELAFFALVYLRASTWTEVGRRTIWGIQGRYFIPVLPLVLYGLVGKSKSALQKKWQWALCAMFVILLITVSMDLLCTKILVYLVE
ncbi:MAG: DUF2142 domain-containing protein [Oscillospiraceae bacterium]|nr:DUF2142 domain-containing protein [Oscillospiraceae bacterium]